ncbi:MAG: ADP-ribosylglycohydrolase family protein [Isosphaeraceae bacterium]
MHGTRWLVALSVLIVLPLASAAAKPPRVISAKVFGDRLRGGWAGQMIGVSYGSVYEFHALGKTIDGPIRPWKPEYVRNSLEQDDLYVEMTFLKVLEEKGIDATARQAGEAFRDSKYRLWHANDAGRTNLRAGIFPPDSGRPRYNPHSDDIDFQIEADLFGLIAPGLFEASGRLCDRFGTVMNSGDGLYGGRFVAAMYCQAYLEPEATAEAVARVVDAGLKAIPAESRYAQLVRDVVAWHRQHPDDWRATWSKLEAKWAHEDLCPEGIDQPYNIDAKVNGGYIVIGLLHGGGDFDRTLEITTRCGQDADCNPSSAAGVLGTVLGFSRIPARYTDDFSSLTGRRFEYTDYDYPGLIAACERIARKLVASEGGSVIEHDGGALLMIPTQTPRPPATLEQLHPASRADLKAALDEFQQRKARVETGRPRER